MSKFACAAILFDLDGVLVDSTGSVDRQWRGWAREQGIDEEAVISIAHGVRSIEVIRAVAPQLDALAETRKLESREAADPAIAVMLGAIDLVRSIPEDQWCVVTSGTRQLASARLERVGIPRPKVMVAADDVVKGKPDPEPYLKGAELLGVDAVACLVIEDAPAGIRSAHAAGMKVIALASTYGASVLGEADAVISSLRELRVEFDGVRMTWVTVE
ncbi:MAG: HAD-IA family hydrolase [Candidatus Sulfotelmatobacter sp.]